MCFNLWMCARWLAFKTLQCATFPGSHSLTLLDPDPKRMTHRLRRSVGKGHRNRDEPKMTTLLVLEVNKPLGKMTSQAYYVLILYESWCSARGSCWFIIDICSVYWFSMKRRWFNSSGSTTLHKLYYHDSTFNLGLYFCFYIFFFFFARTLLPVGSLAHKLLCGLHVFILLQSNLD